MRAFESEDSCRLLRTAPYELYQHSHQKTTYMGEDISWWECEMTMDDAPIRTVLEQSENRLTSEKTTYVQAVRGAALTHAWLCGSALSDTFVGFHDAYMQTDHGTSATSPDGPMDELSTFRAFSAQIAQEPLRQKGNMAKLVFAASKIFCQGTIDMSIYPDHVDNANHEGRSLYVFTPEQRMVIFGLNPGLELWWRPEIERIKISRAQLAAPPLEEFLEVTSQDDPYDIVSRMLCKIVLQPKSAYVAD